MQTVATTLTFEPTANYSAAALYDLSDAELDVVAAAGDNGTLVDISIGNIAVGFQVNNQVNVAVLSFGAVQGGAQTNINNAGTLITYSMQS
jgi:hypothetical protein